MADSTGSTAIPLDTASAVGPVAGVPGAALRGRPLGEILVRTAGLPPEKLEEALAAQRGEQAGVRLGEILVRMKALPEETVLEALALQLDLQFAPRVDPEEASAELAKKIPINFAKMAKVLPLGAGEGGATRVAIADPVDTAALDNVAMLLGTGIEPLVAPPQAILDAINAVYDRAADEHDRIMEGLETEDLESVAHELEEPTDLLDADDEAPIIRLVNSLLFRAVKERASDIHINPEERDLSVRYRIDGELREVIRPPRRIQAALGSRIKIMGGLNIAEKRLPQDGRIRIKIAGKDVDIRLSTVPTSHGERIVMRLLDKSNVLLDLESIGFEPWQLKIMDALITRSHGIVLVTGPTGSGKTTTLYAALSKINSPGLNILTIEDPVEIQLKGVGQVQVNPKIELTFASGLRSFLRQDPDVILVGEIRDLETAEIALKAAQTGHLVLSTLHTNDAPQTLTRLVDMGVKPYAIATSVSLIIAQRLARKLCSYCRQPMDVPAEALRREGFEDADVARGFRVYKAVGCSQCVDGYKGRTGIYQVMPVTDAVGRIIMEGGGAMHLADQAAKDGVWNLRRAGLQKVMDGITSLEEINSVTLD